MNPYMSTVREYLDKNAFYRERLFEQGFVVTNHEIETGEQFPYYGNWTVTRLNDEYRMYVHCTQKAYTYTDAQGSVFFLLGHAYDPFGFEADENILLRNISGRFESGFEAGIDYFNDWTGLFVFGIIKKDEIYLFGDYESMRTAYYGYVNGSFYLVSHEELLANMETLTPNEYVKRLEAYRWYPLYGEGLPGDISHYNELKKLMSNTYVLYRKGQFEVKRFYPSRAIQMCDSEAAYEACVETIAEVMEKSLRLIAMKWKRPAISVTGGMDSRGSLAASYPIRDRFSYFSYNSQPAELVDCRAAASICKSIGVEHTTYDIPLDKGVYPEYDIVEMILKINSNRRKFNPNDIMKRIYFRKADLFDVEVKSWSSEIGRGYCYKRYGVKRFQKKPRSRLINIMNNIYLFSPRLMCETDRVYEEYFDKTFFFNSIYNYDWTDIMQLETRDCRWGANVISCEHMFSYDITIPYNNRHLMDLFLSVPLEDRISDRTHKDFIRKICPPLGRFTTVVRDVNHDKKREWFDKLYYFISSIRII